MTELEKVWNFCEHKKNSCDKNVEVIGMNNMLTPPWQTNMGMSNAYWSVQKCIEIIEEERKTNADKIRAMSNEELAEFFARKSPCNYYCNYVGKSCNGVSCKQGILEWLKSEAES